MVAIRLGICDRTAAWPENQGPEYLADFAAGPVTSSHLFNPAFEDLYLSYRTLMVLRADVSDVDAAALAVHIHRRQPPTARRVGVRIGFSESSDENCSMWIFGGPRNIETVTLHFVEPTCLESIGRGSSGISYLSSEENLKAVGSGIKGTSFLSLNGKSSC